MEYKSSYKSFVFTEIPIKIVKHPLKCYLILNVSLLSLLLQNARHTVLNHHSAYSYSGIGSIERTLSLLFTRISAILLSIDIFVYLGYQLIWYVFRSSLAFWTDVRLVTERSNSIEDSLFPVGFCRPE